MISLHGRQAGGFKFTGMVATTGNQRPWIYGLMVLAFLANCSGLWVTLLGADAPLYASISRHMAETNNYTELFVHGKDWLDKPHFPFWVTAFSFELFGFSTWAYKLPALLFLLGGAVYTYLLGACLYNKTVGHWAVIILLTAQHIIFSSNDVRAEPYLTTLIIGAIYHFYRAYTSKKMLHLFLGALLSACAVMTKGPFALFPIAAAIGGELLFKKQWKQLFHWRWLLALVLTAIFILPEIYCLWYQFDAHPEKTVFGQTGVSGIRFFFWDSQFGRFVNTGPIQGSGSPAFFLHTLLWAFLPWSVITYIAVFRSLRSQWQRQNHYKEWLTLSGAIATFVLFSLSRFQLPHYTNIIFPLLAIFLPGYLYQLQAAKEWKLIRIVQGVLIALLLVAPFIIAFVFRPATTPVFIIACMLFLLVLLLGAHRFTSFNRQQLVLVRSALAAVFFNLYLLTSFYPSLLRYQSGSEAAFYSNRQYPGWPVVQLANTYSFPLEFYLHSPLITIDSLPAYQRLQPPFLLYLPQEQRPDALPVVQRFAFFPVSKINARFFRYPTRQETLDSFVLVKVERQ